MFMIVFVFFFKQKTAYEMRISDWSSDVCSSDLRVQVGGAERGGQQFTLPQHVGLPVQRVRRRTCVVAQCAQRGQALAQDGGRIEVEFACERFVALDQRRDPRDAIVRAFGDRLRSEEHTSELQSLMRHSYAVFCFTKKNGKLN